MAGWETYEPPQEKSENSGNAGKWLFTVLAGILFGLAAMLFRYC